ncbi:MAG: hypothetical protein AAFV43_03770 [Planctomycetota bacterium]
MGAPTNDNLATNSCDSLEDAILLADRRMVLATAGGGSGAIARLLSVPGASETVLQAVALQAERAMTDWIGNRPPQFCSEGTARAMAVACWRRAQQLADNGEAEHCVGAAITASLATTRPKRGDHRLHVAVHTDDSTHALNIVLEKGDRSRADEEAIASRSVLATIADAIGAKPMDLSQTPPGMTVTARSQAAPSDWQDLLAGQRRSAAVRLDADAPLRVLLPGSFNPPHAGHERMAEIASQTVGAPTVYELAVTNVDKPPLDFLEIADRLATLCEAPVLLSRAPRFIDKARLAPGCTFAVGADTIARLGDSRYCGGDPAVRDAQFEEIGALGCRFLVFGRNFGAGFRTLNDIDLPAGLAQLCTGVPEEDFRMDVSSTDLRG